MSDCAVLESRTVQILASCATYFSTKHAVSDTSRLSLLAVLRLSKLVYLFGTAPTPKIIEQWHNVFTNISNVVMELRSSLKPFADVPECRVTAYEILQLVDQDDRLDFDDFNPDVPWTSANEDELYRRWNAVVDPNRFQCPDVMIELLSDISSNTVDSEGRLFWRPRRVRERSSPAVRATPALQ